MRFTPSTSLACLIASTAIAVANNDSSAMMRFTNNDQIEGHLVSLSDDTLVWSSDILAEPATFDISKVVDLALPAENKSPDTGHTATLTLKNRDMKKADIVRGQLTDITEDSIVLDTWYAGAMNFNRPMVSKIDIDGGTSHHYRGPNSIEGWQVSPKDSWYYKRQAFISEKAGSIAHDKLLPEQCSISFLVQRKPGSNSLDMKVLLFSDDVDNVRPRAGYELSFQRSSIYMRSGKTRRFLGSNHSRELSQNEAARIEIRASSISGKVCLLINDQMAETWTDPQFKQNEFGSVLHFVSGTDKPLRISDIRIAPWDGKVTELPQGRMRHLAHENVTPPAKKTPEDKSTDKGIMLLANGDKLKGDVDKIEDGVISLKTLMGDILLPVGRFRNLNVEGIDEEEAILRQGDIRAFFADGSSMVFRLDRVDGEHLHGSSQNFGSASFKLNAINRIEFDPHNPELESMRNVHDW